MKLSMFMAACLLAGAAEAATGSSNEFRLDTRRVKVARATEPISYSTAWATNLTAAQQAGAKAVVKVNPCLKTSPKYLVVDMSGGRSAARWPISYLDEVPSGGWTDEYKTEKLVLRYIPAGSFIMGGRATDYPGAVNTNLHMVTLTKPFYIGVFECTQRQWELAMGTRPSAFSNETCYATRPVEQVSYVDIRGGSKGLLWPQSSEVDSGSFMGVLRSKVDVGVFDLPTEAQWEYACRAGTTTALYSGKDISVVNAPADGKSSPEILELGRCKGNSGWHTDYQDLYAADSHTGTAIVGSCPANPNGLYDICGNVQELCLDVYDDVLIGSIDPIGPKRVDGENYHPYRGGGWSNNDHCYSSSNRGVRDVSDMSRYNNVGFRICLHNATVYPSADSASILVNASGAGAADWTPTQAGTYQLTHEVQVDGTTVAPMESALFKVEGPELVIKANGELVSGVEVEVEKVGGGGQWNIYYSLDGSEPTAGSTKYEGPFALPESATVKAVAISAGGVSSEIASKELALSPALAVEDVAARQRYPWNGKVDIDCEITGDATKKYSVTFAADDEVGHTNLAIKTVTLHSTPTPTTYTSSPSSEFVLPPGRYRFTWDAAADLPKGTKFGGVSVSIDAVPSPLADWKRVVTISTDGYAGNETLTDVPVLVRLSSAIEGFDYADFAAPDTGADMIFTDMEGSARYPYEIDEWHRGGESLVWVKLPELKKGTKFLLAYGNAETGDREQGIGNSEERKHEVWREYAGVWHMNEDSGTAFNSAIKGLDALPSCNRSDKTGIAYMVATNIGACGRARVNGLRGNYLLVPVADVFKFGSVFYLSGWFYADGYVKEDDPRLISKKANGYWGKPSGFEINYEDSMEVLMVRGAGEFGSTVKTPTLLYNWQCLVVVYDGGNAYVYVNGSLVATKTINPVTDNDDPITIGGGVTMYSLDGQYDEIRLRGGTLSADRIKADYDMIANRDFCTYGKVEGGAGK